MARPNPHYTFSGTEVLKLSSLAIFKTNILFKTGRSSTEVVKIAYRPKHGKRKQCRGEMEQA